VTEILEGNDSYKIYIKYGIETMSDALIFVYRDLSKSPLGFDGYEVSFTPHTSFNQYATSKTYFVLANFATPITFLKELAAFVKAEVDIIPF
jgi:hypothetical protein